MSYDTTLHKPPIVIALCFDAQMIIGARMLLSSIIEVHREQEREVVLHAFSTTPISSPALINNPIPPHVSLRIHIVSTVRFDPIKIGPWLSSATFLRLGLAESMNDEKVLYLDCDTLVRRDLSSLFDIELTGALLAAAPDSILIHDRSTFRVQYGDMSLLPSKYVEGVCGVEFTNYFNAGVLLLNLRMWRDEDISSQILDYIQRRGELFFGDQDALNAVVHNRYIKLDARWNAISYGLYPAEPNCELNGEWKEIVEAWRADPWIIHFVGASKPWIAEAQKTIYHCDAQRHLLAAALPVKQPLKKESLALPPPLPMTLPLVSVIVVNYNYTSYLRKCISSIYLQDYSRFECILIDNASTDEFCDEIEGICREFVSLKVVKRKENHGQGNAWQEGFRKSQGKYVMFVDADDFLLQHCISTHVCTHLRLPHSIGFTSTDMIQIEDDQVVLGTYFEAAFERNQKNVRIIDQMSLKSLDYLSETEKRSIIMSSDCNARLYAVKTDTKTWVWSPTSANMYRKDALKHFIVIPSLSSFRSNADTFMNIALNVFHGSVLIDRPLSAYRLHRFNAFSRGPSLFNSVNFDKKNDAVSRSSLLIAEFILANLGAFNERSPSIFQLWRSIHILIRIAGNRPNKWKALEDAYMAINGQIVNRTVFRLRRKWKSRLPDR